MKKSKWLVMFSVLMVCVGVIGPLPALAGDAPVRELPHAPNRPTAACTVPSVDYPTIAAALADPTCDPIVVSAGTYTENLTVARPVTIQGDGADTTIVDGGGLSAVFVITNTAAVTMTGLTIQHGTGITDAWGSISGGGIYNVNGNVLLRRSVVYGNTAEWGGGVCNDSAMRIEETHILSNTVTRSGGGLYSGLVAVIVDSTFQGNTANYGGGLYNATVVTVSHTQIAGNIATYGGGIFSSGRAAAIDHSLITGNTAITATGGFYNSGSVATIDDSIISYNTAGAQAGVKNSADYGNATMTINASQIISNTTGADSNGGGGVINSSYTDFTANLTLNNCLVSYNVTHGSTMLSGTGGGVWNTVYVGAANATSIVTINDSTISHNRAVNGGGVANTFLQASADCTAIANINNSTIHDNATFALAGNQLGNGGGVLNLNGTVNMVNSTLSDNQANGMPATGTDYSGLGGGLLNAGSLRPAMTHLVHTTVAGNRAVATGGGLVTGLLDAGGAGSGTTIRNSIVVGNNATLLNANCSSQPTTVPNMFVSLGYNLENTDTCNLTQVTDLTNADPLLEPLADNDGDTWTRALPFGSPAVDVIPAADCAAPTDQRGVTRPQGPACDIGAYERESPTLRVTKSVAVSIDLPNGDFESGPTVWTEYSAQGWDLILNSIDLDLAPHSGDWAAWLGGDDDETSEIEQPVTVLASAPYLAYWHWIESDDWCGYDFGYVLINGTTVDEYDLCADTATGGWVPHVVDLSAYAGQSVDLVIGAETDDSEPSNLFVDDVSFQSDPASDIPLGGEIWYTIVVQNTGDVLASGVALTDVLPAGVAFGTGVITGSVIFPSPNTLTWGPWDVDAGESYTIRFTAVVTDSETYYGRTITNTVDYTSANAGSGSAEAAFTIMSEPQLALSILKSVATAHTPVLLGDVVTYTIIIENSGDVLASSVALTDVLPAGVTFETGIITGSLLLPAPNTLTWGPWDVGAGEAYTLSFTAVVTDSQAFAGQTITNTVEYTSGNAGSGSSQAVFTIAGQEHYYIYLPLVVRQS